MNYKGPLIDYELLMFLLGNDQFYVGILATIVNLFLCLIIYKSLLKDTIYFSFKKFTIPSYFLICYYIIFIFPSIVYFTYYESDIRYTFFLAVQCVPFLFLLGVHMANLFNRNPQLIISNFLNTTINHFNENLLLRRTFFLFLSFSALVMFLYVFNASYIPLIGALTRYGEELPDFVRFSVYRSDNYIIYLYALTIRLLLPYCLIYSYYLKKFSNQQHRSLFFYLVLLWSIFFSLLTLERQGVLGITVTLLLSVYFINSNSRLAKNLPKIFVALLLIMIFGGIVSIAQYNNTIYGMEDIINYMHTFLIYRILFDPSYITYVIIEQFYSNELRLLSNIRLFTLLGFEYDPITAIGFVADCYISFGYYGMFLYPIVLGFILQNTQLTCFKGRSIESLIFFIIFALASSWLIYSNMLPTMIFSVFLFGIPLARYLNRYQKPLKE